MKCEHCGGNLSLNDKYCPHCGCINEQAKRHVEDMERYEGEFEETKEEVYENTRRFTQFSVRIIVIAVLLAASLLLIVLRNNAWSLHYNYIRSKAESNYDTYSAAMDQMLADGNYTEFSDFIDAHHITTYQGPYERYAQINPATRYYAEIYEKIMAIHRPSYYDEGEEEETVSRLAECLDSYYERIAQSYEDYDIDEELTNTTIARMTQTIEALLVAYCGLDADEAAALPQMTKARRAVLIEEKALPLVTEHMAQVVEEHR